ncbi:MAG TPA: chaperone modulator CbpM [Bacteroidales bacterium]
MQTDYLIAIDKFCANHNIEISFISSLQQNGLIEITTIKEEGYIDPDQLLLLEKIVRLYYELDINIEGIETINYLLQRIENMHNEIIRLRNQLRLYELNDEQ